MTLARDGDPQAGPQRGPVEMWLRAAQDHGRWPPDEAVWTAKAREFDAAFDALESALRGAREWMPDADDIAYTAEGQKGIKAMIEKLDAALALAEAVRS